MMFKYLSGLMLIFILVTMLYSFSRPFLLSSVWHCCEHGCKLHERLVVVVVDDYVAVKVVVVVAVVVVVVDDDDDGDAV